MSENIKPATFRLNEDDINKFKEFAKQNNLTQEEAFTSLLNALELNNAKATLGNRSKSIEVFQTTVNSLVKFYINSLEENAVAEDRIRDELSKELKTKDNTIDTMFEELQTLKIDKSEKQNMLNQQSSELDIAKKQILDWIDKNDKLNKDIEDKQKSIDVLTRNNINQMQQLEEYKDLKSDNELLLKQIEKLKSQNISLENMKTQLESKIENSEDMISFYKENISELKKNIEQYKSDIKELEVKHDKYIEETKTGYELSLKKEIELIKDQLYNKYSFDLTKKDLVINKLKSQLETLKTSKNLLPLNTKQSKSNKKNTSEAE